MVTALDVKPCNLIEKVAQELKKEGIIEPPEWTKYVKTGAHKERPPNQEDWYYLRCAAILRKVYKRGSLGVSRLRVLYGGKKRRGHKTEHFYRGSGKVIRTALQQLEKEGLIEKDENKGRKISKKGRSFLDKMALEVKKNE